MMRNYFNTNKVLATGILTVATVTIFFACKKDDKVSSEKNDAQTLAAAQVNAEAAALYDDAFQLTVNTSYSESDLNRNSRLAGAGAAKETDMCASLSITPVELGVWPKTVTLDFGTSGCTFEGRTRKGKLVFTLNKFLFASGGTASLTFENYSVNDIKIEGTQTITNTTTSEGFGYTYSVAGGKVTYPSGKAYTYTTNRKISQTDGSATLLDLGDDVYSLEGTANLSTDSIQATFNVQEPLVKKADCLYLSKGILAVTVNGYKGNINYGDNVCDDKATLTVGDKSKEITLTR
ncbi:hypothetical protein [uncultured Chitinophaga sp.]|uniref:hypothetical protein n=1 Tax=uncultured Chitinophaga sp. TaxID=339340 RepID=UPI0025F6850C|nr:hypothetical protein [uncultured Chitinophaga sp.]